MQVGYQKIINLTKKNYLCKYRKSSNIKNFKIIKIST